MLILPCTVSMMVTMCEWSVAGRSSPVDGFMFHALAVILTLYFHKSESVKQCKRKTLVYTCNTYQLFGGGGRLLLNTDISSLTHWSD